MNSCPKCGCTMIMDSSSGQYSCGCNFVVKEQPQKPGRPFSFRTNARDAGLRVYSEDQVDNYISYLESENTALKERVAELEKQVFRLKQSVNEYARYHPMADSSPVYPEVPEREED